WNRPDRVEYRVRDSAPSASPRNYNRRPGPRIWAANKCEVALALSPLSSDRKAKTAIKGRVPEQENVAPRPGIRYSPSRIDAATRWRTGDLSPPAGLPTDHRHFCRWLTIRARRRTAWRRNEWRGPRPP